MTRCPCKEFVNWKRVHHAIARNPGGCRFLATEVLPLELAWSMGVGVDGDQTTERKRQFKKVLGRIETLRPGVDLDGGVTSDTCLEDLFRVERRWRSSTADDYSPGAVSEHIDVRALHRSHHSPGHLSRVHAQLGVDARNDEVETGKQLLVLIERAVFQDVDLDSGQDPERRKLGVQLSNNVELLDKTVLAQSMGDGEAWTVVGERPVLVAKLSCSFGHLANRGAAV